MEKWLPKQTARAVILGFRSCSRDILAAFHVLNCCCPKRPTWAFWQQVKYMVSRNAAARGRAWGKKWHLPKALVDRMEMERTKCRTNVFAAGWRYTLGTSAQIQKGRSSGGRSGSRWMPFILYLCFLFCGRTLVSEAVVHCWGGRLGVPCPGGCTLGPVEPSGEKGRRTLQREQLCIAEGHPCREWSRAGRACERQQRPRSRQQSRQWKTAGKNREQKKPSPRAREIFFPRDTQRGPCKLQYCANLSLVQKTRELLN